MEGQSWGVVSFFILLAAFLIYSFQDRTAYKQVLTRLDQYIANNLELKKSLANLDKSTQDQRTVLMSYKLEIDQLQDRCVKIEGSQSRLTKNQNILRNRLEPRQVNVQIIENQKSH